MQRQLTLRAIIAVVIATTSLVASLAIGFLLRSASGTPDAGEAASGLLLGAAVYAPFALVALLLPALAVPMARMILTTGFGAGDTAGMANRWSPAIDAVALWGSAEVLLLVLLFADPGTSTPAAMHLLLALYAAIAAWQLSRRQNHDDSLPPPEPS